MDTLKNGIIKNTLRYLDQGKDSNELSTTFPTMHPNDIDSLLADMFLNGLVSYDEARQTDGKISYGITNLGKVMLRLEDIHPVTRFRILEILSRPKPEGYSRRDIFSVLEVQVDEHLFLQIIKVMLIEYNIMVVEGRYAVNNETRYNITVEGQHRYHEFTARCSHIIDVYADSVLQCINIGDQREYDNLIAHHSTGSLLEIVLCLLFKGLIAGDIDDHTWDRLNPLDPNQLNGYKLTDKGKDKLYPKPSLLTRTLNTLFKRK